MMDKGLAMDSAPYLYKMNEYDNRREIYYAVGTPKKIAG